MPARDLSIRPSATTLRGPHSALTTRQNSSRDLILRNCDGPVTICTVDRRESTVDDNLAARSTRWCMNGRPSTAPRILLCDDSPVERSSPGALPARRRLRGGRGRRRRRGHPAHQAPAGRRGPARPAHAGGGWVRGAELSAGTPPGAAGDPAVRDAARTRSSTRSTRCPTPELPPLLIKPIDPDQLLGVLELQLSGGLPPVDSPGGNGSPS